MRCSTQLQSIVRPCKKIGRQLGTSMLEVMGALAVGALIMVGVADETNRYIDNTKDVFTAEHARLYAAAARAYTKVNTQGIPANGLILSAADIAAYLPVGFAKDPKNPYGQTPKVLLKNRGGGVEGYLIYVGGEPIPTGRRQFVSVMAGIGGGFVDDAGIPQGSGWSDSNYNDTFGQVLSATSGSVVVSLSFLNPDEQKDCRYLSVAPLSTAGCGDMLNRNLDMRNYGIRVTSLTSVTSITAGNAINIIGAARFTDTVNITSWVTVGGALSATGTVSAQVLSPGLLAELGGSCMGYRLGTIAQLSTTRQSDKGTLLSCQSQPSLGATPATQSWRSVVAVATHTSVVLGCTAANSYCQTPPSSCNVSHPPAAADNLSVTKPVPQFPGCVAGTWGGKLNTAGIDTHFWSVDMGQQVMCALGFDTQTQSASFLDSNGRSDKTFCRVFSVNEAGVIRWRLRVGSANNTPIACQAVCLTGSVGVTSVSATSN